MMVDDLRSLGGDMPDVCVVGSGPVGLATALECEKRGLSVLILEGGGSEPVQDHPGETHGEVVDSARHAPPQRTACRALGGSSWWWGGRCIPFDAIDFKPRDYVPEARWPIDESDVEPYLAAAAAYLDCGDADFLSEGPGWPELPGGATFGALERWSREKRLARVHREHLAQSGNLVVATKHRVTGIEIDAESGRVLGLNVATPSGEHVLVGASHYVLAGGGLGTTRLLLLLQRKYPDLFGGADGPLGRYYMGHAFGGLADLVLTDEADATAVDFHHDPARTFVRRRFNLTEEAQQRERLLNIGFYAENPHLHDPRHGIGLLSLIFLALAYEPLGRRIVSDGIRRQLIGPEPHRWRAHMANVAQQPVATFRELARLLAGCFLANPRWPGFLFASRTGRYLLAYHSEQMPRAESRVMLGDTVDSFGVPRLVIDFNYCEAEAVSIVKAHEILDRGLRESGKGRLEYHAPPDQLVAKAFGQFSDGFHQIGTTRMGDDPATSVVDRHCRVHDFANLHVASSSVFCSSGQANPTFMAAALGVRLAHRLALSRENDKLVHRLRSFSFGVQGPGTTSTRRHVGGYRARIRS